MKKTIFVYILIIVLTFGIEIPSVLAVRGCGPKGCTEPLTDKDYASCKSSETCNCTLGPGGKCPAYTPELIGARYEVNEKTKEITYYDTGWIAAWSNIGGVWVTPTGDGRTYQPGGTYTNSSVNFNVYLSSVPNAKNFKLKSIERVDSGGISSRWNQVVSKYHSSNYSINSGGTLTPLGNLTDEIFNVSFTLASLTLKTSVGNDGQNAKLPWQDEKVEGYIYYIPTKVVITYEEEKQVCDFNNPAHFGVDYKSLTGTGPNGENCCTYFSNMYSGIDNVKLNELYKKYPQCKPSGTTTPPPSQCTYFIDTKCPGNCTGNIGEGNVKDMQNWTCIYKSDTETDRNVRTHYFDTKNRYCKIFCREEVKYYFPPNSVTVRAGTHFTVATNIGLNTWTPIKFEGETECRSEKNDYKLFESDWRSANERVSSTWDRLQTEIARDNSRAQPRQSATKDCDRRCVDWRDLTCDGTRPDGTAYRYDCSYCARYEYFGYTISYPTGYNGSYSAQEGSWCSTGSAPRSGTPAAQSAYNSALQTRQSYLTQIEYCNFTYSYNYNTLNPVVTVTYEEPHYGMSIKLESIIKSKGSERRYFRGVGTNIIPYTSSSFSSLGSNIMRYDCNSQGSRCSTAQQNYPINDGMLLKVGREVTYKMPDGIYPYIEKESGKSLHTRPGGNYVSVGYSNFPVHFSTPSGKYKLDLKYEGFGKIGTLENRFNKFVFGDAIRQSQTIMKVNPLCSKDYKCTYNVINDILDTENPTDPNCKTPPCGGGGGGGGGGKPLGLDLLFRQIKLSDPFPGIDGKGRKPGENWSNTTDINKVILNNRGVKGEEVYYKKEPLYKIKLDPWLINEIRKYNRNSRGGYADFNLTCIAGTGKECKSTFIRDTYKKYFELASCNKNSPTGCHNY